MTNTTATISLTKDDATLALARSLNNIRFWTDRMNAADRIELNYLRDARGNYHRGAPLITRERY